jgi:TolB protein
MAAGGGNAERVTFAGGYNISPSISPDGRTLAYVTRSGNAFRLATLDLSAPGAQQRCSPTPRRRASELRANGRLLITPREFKAAAC